MTLQELFENAHLDALGMLDAAEQAAFEKAFAQSAPGIQAQIRAEQARWAEHQVLLPAIDPSPELKDRVLAAIAAESVHAEVLSDDAMSPFELRSTTRVSRWWRVGTIGMATAAVALLAAFLYVGSTNERLREDLARGGFEDGMRLAMGRGETANAHLHDLFLEADVVRAPMAKTAHAEAIGFKGEMTVLSRPGKWSEARVAFLVPRAATGQQYCLVEVTQDGKQADRKLRTFDSDASLQSFTIEPLEKGTRLALVAVALDGRVDLSQALLTVTL